MTTIKPDHDFSREVDCTYKAERYSVRDNGAVLRHPRVDSRLRPTDKQWMFGKQNNKTGYLEIACVPVHRIVATAFHGEPPTKDHVVDHIDTNKCNNRPTNLRWVTRLENILLNPITAKRIAFICGSVEAFLADPAKFKDLFQDPNFQWMCTVSQQEAQASLQRLMNWAKNDQRPNGGALGDWLFNLSMEPPPIDDPLPEVSPIQLSKTFGAAQYNWKIPTEFPCCPQEITATPMIDYLNKLVPGSLFCRNELYSSLVFKSAVTNDSQSIFVLTTSTDADAIKPWALAQITFENDLWVHASIQSFFTQEGAEKQFCLAQGFEWLGGDSVDDYC